MKIDNGRRDGLMRRRDKPTVQTFAISCSKPDVLRARRQFPSWAFSVAHGVKCDCCFEVAQSEETGRREQDDENQGYSQYPQEQDSMTSPAW
jgi:hypothetical protein